MSTNQYPNINGYQPNQVPNVEENIKTAEVIAVVEDFNDRNTFGVKPVIYNISVNIVGYWEVKNVGIVLFLDQNVGNYPFVVIISGTLGYDTLKHKVLENTQLIEPIIKNPGILLECG